MKGNVIPRKFDTIAVKMLVNTNMDKAGDTVLVYYNDWGLRMLHFRTGEYSQANLAMLRNKNCCEFTKINY